MSSEGENIWIYDECEGGVEKSIPRITDWHHEAWGVMTNGDREGPIFLSNSHTNNGFFLLTTKYLILYWKNMKRLPENPKYAEMRHSDVILTLQWLHGSTCGQHAVDVRLFVFHLSHGLVRVCEVELSHMGKNNGNPDLVCEKMRFVQARLKLCCSHVTIYTYCTFGWYSNALHQIFHNAQTAHACWCKKAIIVWLCVCTGDNPLAKARGLSSCTYAHTIQ